jgi:hypothetical protein
VNDEMNDDADSRRQLRLHAYHPAWTCSSSGACSVNGVFGVFG